jgi:chromosome segregation ATPase
VTDERTLAFLHELEKTDEAVAAVLTELDELAAEAERVRARAVELEAFMIRFPAERERADGALAEARDDVDERRETLARAEAEIAAAEEAGDAARSAAARRAVVRAGDALRSAERAVTSLADDLSRLEREGEEAERETTGLHERAQRVAGALRARPGLAEHAGGEPASDLAGISAWAGGVRAALFVARGRLAAEREAVIRQANELGAVVLGEPLSASSAAVVARRIERADS